MSLTMRPRTSPQRLHLGPGLFAVILATQMMTRPAQADEHALSGTAWMGAADVLVAARDYPGAIQAYDDVLKRLEAGGTPGLRWQIAEASIRKAIAVGKLGRHDDEM